MADFQVNLYDEHEAIQDDLGRGNNMENKIRAITEELREIKQKKMDLEYRLSEIVEEYDGSLQDAIAAGIAKLTFPMPKGFYSRWRESTPVNKIVKEFNIKH